MKNSHAPSLVYICTFALALSGVGRALARPGLGDSLSALLSTSSSSPPPPAPSPSPSSPPSSSPASSSSQPPPGASRQHASETAALLHPIQQQHLVQPASVAQQQQQPQTQQQHQPPAGHQPPAMGRENAYTASSSAGGLAHNQTAVQQQLAAAHKYGSNVLEVLSNVGKAIHQQIMSAGGQIQIITAPSALGAMELANSKKNEYQQIGPVSGKAQQIASQLPTNAPSSSSNQTGGLANYREQGEQLRQEIVRRASQLQQVVSSSMDALKSSSDIIVRRLLEQLNGRLDQAKSKADKIINEPATNEMAIRTLNAINLGLNNINNIVTNLVSRLDLGNKHADASQRLAAGDNGAAPALLDPSRLRQGLQQIGQQFHSALSAARQHTHLQHLGGQPQKQLPSAMSR